MSIPLKECVCLFTYILTYTYFAIYTGDELRAHAKRGTELGKEAKKYIDAGCFVPDEIVTSFVKSRLRQEDVKQRGCLLDGFPRTTDQANKLLKCFDVDRFIFIDVPNSVLVEVLERR